ncbi:hypothetical protein PGUG_03678 [Meyerozyma guilliermondii ATCC 6260]|uniref:EKC/KEOPS complex subunit CGI121 n=1 Tax=Meyerozyma guilliermondii (strain ATCC 6260 / CBS 566 / DSM 6381 / JCM 1539 / NBRC 10279 / NRRL Y-324) TaxID=294746 RepID=A5DK77_PICGU|nr:uncharacterized protein PGUG_03678 [Meyerozyma guilliermondii ATCC 6260]EDK39581.1 hypothetical protein PGUG_03678 [Meyerozyma guilliermondii ATCC 6260]
MVYSTYSFPQFPQYRIFATCFTGVSAEKLKEVKEHLVAADKNYDFCFLNTNFILSQELLLNSIHKSILNKEFDCMKAKTLNTEIIFNLSPTNKITDAFRSFGVEEGCSSVIVVHITTGNENFATVNQHLEGLLSSDSRPENIKIEDETLSSFVDVSKFKKLYKLNDAVGADSYPTLTRLAISACHLRGL